MNARRAALNLLFIRHWTGTRTRTPADAGLDDLRALAEELEREQDPGRLWSLIVTRLGDLSGCDEVIICDRAPAEERFRPRCPTIARQTGLVFAARGAFVRWLRVNQTALVLPDDSDVFAYLPEDERTELLRAGVRICLPCIARGQLSSIVLLCRPNGRLPDVTERLDLLQRCCDQATAVWDRAIQAAAERERQQAVARAQQLAAAGQLAAAMAHEIRNPLAVIRSSVQFVAEAESGGGAQREVLAEVVAEVDRINRSISNVLGFSRPPELELVRIDVRPVVDQALSLLGPYCRHHSVQVGLTAPDRAVVIDADPRELQQVLLNVLLNACQATVGGGRVDLSVVTSADPGGVEGEVHLVIADTGQGMTESELSRAFEPFYTTKTNGTGLGLPICRQVMTRLGGDIRLTSDAGLGTTVTLVLPEPVP